MTQLMTAENTLIEVLSSIDAIWRRINLKMLIICYIYLCNCPTYANSLPVDMEKGIRTLVDEKWDIVLWKPKKNK